MRVEDGYKEGEITNRTLGIERVWGMEAEHGGKKDCDVAWSSNEG